MKYILIASIIFFASCNSITQGDLEKSESEYFLGVKQFIWEDEARADDYYGGNRIINAQVWYPSEKNAVSNKPTDYYFQIEKAYQHLDSWSEEDFKAVQLVQTKSTLNPPFKEDKNKYPLIIFSPSLGGHLSQYTFFAEHLADKGYIVMGINHLYESEYVIDKQGSVITSNLTFHDSLKAMQIPEQITAEKYREVKGVRQKILGQDIIFGLDQLLKESFFENKINADQVGVFGHSIGGAGAIYASVLDKRIKAVVDLDGTPPTVALQNGIAVPFMFIEDLTDYKNHKGYAKMHSRRSNFCELNQSESWRILLGGANHNSFLDINYFLAEDEGEKKKALGFLMKTADFMESFFAHNFRNARLNIIEVKPYLHEVYYFEK